ncbi:twin-arginine translocase TatA/TatE family subunit [Leucobacter massiliensis]|uniref:Sec-independent protein translocase protein TatA n=1 Tax=Leucobacter massiliensis TaxID=1686285 RepID=A0A2S9QM08_9MICO|nr:twin-arginine translocase TatA/TatE family subunit [Leucobacter massiliensis]PRI10617.1 hypothetical protein B4915_11140 [Leucobacter massiliensis]
MLGNLSGWHLIAILFVILLLFGAPKLPGLAKSLGQSMRILKKEVRSDADDRPAAAPEAEETRPAQTSGDVPSAPASPGTAPAAPRADVP